MLIDAHNHLQDARLAPYEGEILNELTKIGVDHFVVNGTHPDDWARVAALAEKDSRVLPAFGLHPWRVAERGDDWLQQLENYLPASGGIGEIGLDKWIRDHDLPLQKEVFHQQIDLARRYDLPTTIHCLQAWGSLLECLQDRPLPKCGFLLHSFGGPGELMDDFLSLGAYFSLSGYFFHERKDEKLELFRRIPLDRLLLETDAPDMPLPSSLDAYLLEDSGKHINHPGNLRVIYAETARFLGIPVEELAAQLQANFRKLFGTSGSS